MRSILYELTRELRDLRILVDSTQPVTKALQTHAELIVRQYAILRRRYEYAAFTVALYSCFEQFCEALVSSQVELLAARTRYRDLPVALVAKHLEKSADLIKEAGKGRYSKLRERDLMSNMIGCLDEISPYAMNMSAVVHHDNNLRPNDLNSLFAVTGLSGILGRVRSTDAVVTWYASVAQSEKPLDVPALAIEQRLVALVEKRNEVARRGIPIEVDGGSEMIETLSFVEALCSGLYAIGVWAYLDSLVKQGRARAIGPVTEWFSKRSAAVIKAPTERIYVGQPVFALSQDWGARWGFVDSLRLDDKEAIGFVPGTSVAEVGLVTGFLARRGTQLFVLRTADELVWEPRQLALSP
jgi:hypothetical protein